MKEQYMKVTIELLDKRSDGSLSDEEEDAYLEMLDSLWTGLTEIEQKEVETWIEDELERRK